MLQDHPKKSQPRENFSKLKNCLKNSRFYIFSMLISALGIWMGHFYGGILFGSSCCMMIIVFFGKKQLKKSVDRIETAIKNNQQYFNW